MHYYILYSRLLQSSPCTTPSTLTSSRATWNSPWRPCSSTPWRRERAPSSLPVWRLWTTPARTPERWLTSSPWLTTGHDRPLSPGSWLRSSPELLPLSRRGISKKKNNWQPSWFYPPSWFSTVFKQHFRVDICGINLQFCNHWLCFFYYIWKFEYSCLEWM